MKQIALFLILVVFSCTKPDSSNDITAVPQQPDTGTFIQFTFQGDSFNREKIVMNGQAGCNFGGTGRYMTASCTRNGYNITSYFDFKLDSAGTVDLDSLKNTSNFRFYGTNIEYYLLTSFEGKFNITHYPDSINDYLKGSFSGSYIDKQSGHLFTITNGRFRVQRKL